MDSWLFDPSVTGRWEYTPTIVPILERIDVIERDTGEFVDVTQVMPGDLIPEPVDYRVAPGDAISIEILDFIQAGVPAEFDRLVDSRGFVSIPQLGEIAIGGLTRSAIEDRIARAIVDGGLLDNPLVTVTVPGQRQAAFSVFGAISGVGRYAIPSPDYRLLQALTDAGGVSPAIPKVFIIRQVTLSDEALGAPERSGSRPGQPSEPAPSGENLIDLINELTRPEEGAERPPSPGVFASSAASDGLVRIALGQDSASQSGSEGREPPIDLEDTRPQTTSPVVTPQTTIQPPSASRWVFVNGQWVQSFPAAPAAPGAGLPEGAEPTADSASTGALVTQRVIEVPVGPLLQGVAQYNIVVRPGDVISVPAPPQGVVYVTGPGIQRPGTYNMPFTGKLTMQRLVASAGGLSAVAIPERVDLVRMIGENRQATIRVDYKAIAAGNQPDLLLKPDDLLNFGTNFFATPAAVIRGGFRMTYGFGFLLDRNFGNDVFGAPPTNVQGQ